MKFSRKEQRLINLVRKAEKHISKIKKEEEGRGNKIKVVLQMVAQVTGRLGIISQSHGILMYEVLYDTADN